MPLHSESGAAKADQLNWNKATTARQGQMIPAPINADAAFSTHRGARSRPRVDPARKCPLETTDFNESLLRSRADVGQLLAMPRQRRSGTISALMESTSTGTPCIQLEFVSTANAPAWARNRTTIIFVTHDLDEALLLADRIFLMGGKSPGRLTEVVTLPFPRPRHPSDLVARSDYAAIKADLVRKLHLDFRPAKI